MASGRTGAILKLEGFEEILKKIEKAGGSIDKSVEVAMKKSADIMDAELKTQLNAVTQSGLASRMDAPEVKKEGNEMVAHVGFHKGNYDPKNLSDGYKALFLNVGTPRRSKHGKIKARGYIKKAKNKARPKIKKQQEEVFKEILEKLK